MLTRKKKSIVLLHGDFDKTFFDELQRRKLKDIFMLEGRPDLNAVRVNARELLKRKIKPTLIADNMAGFLFLKNLVKEVWLAYQFADHNGAVCRIGSLILGVLGKRHNVCVNVYTAKGKTRFIGKQRDIFYFNGIRVAPAGIKGYVPLVEWVPKKYITKIYEQ